MNALRSNYPNGSLRHFGTIGVDFRYNFPLDRLELRHHQAYICFVNLHRLLHFPLRELKSSRTKLLLGGTILRATQHYIHETPKSSSDR